LEIDADQGGQVEKIAQSAGFWHIGTEKDLAKRDRVVILK
jgi:methylase of polypeptide subunit release factors